MQGLGSLSSLNIILLSFIKTLELYYYVLFLSDGQCLLVWLLVLLHNYYERCSIMLCFNSLESTVDGVHRIVLTFVTVNYHELGTSLNNKF